MKQDIRLSDPSRCFDDLLLLESILSQQYVYGKHQVAEWSAGAKGPQLTGIEAINKFGIYTMIEVNHEGSALMPEFKDYSEEYNILG